MRYNLRYMEKQKKRKRGRPPTGNTGVNTNIYLPSDIVLVAREKFKQNKMSLSEAIREFLKYEVKHKRSLLDFLKKGEVSA